MRASSTQLTSWPHFKFHQPFKVSPHCIGITDFPIIQELFKFSPFQAREGQIPAFGDLLFAGALPLPEA